MTKKNNCNNPLEGVCSKDNDAEGGSENNLLAATRRRRAEIRRIRAAVGTGFRSGSASALAPASASPDNGKIKRVRSETESSGEVDDDDSSFSSTSPPSSDSDGGAGGGGGEGSGGVAGAFASVIGRRREMEDAVTVAPGFARGYDFYGVYDGHGGAGVAQVCRERLHVVVAEEVEEVGERWEQVMAASFAKVDEEVGKAEVGGTSVGSTAVVAVVGPGRIVVANCGDSRAVLSRGGVAVPLSIDHKPERPDELERVEAAGGRVINWYGYRILGVLATSRSIGDYHLKPYVISEPEVKVIDRNARDEFIILASDGLWDVVSNEVACKITRQCLRGRATRMFPEAINRHTAADAATLLVQLALSRGSRDNVSVVVVELKRLVGDRASRVA